MTHKEFETKEHMELEPTLDSKSGGDMGLPDTFRKPLKTRDRGRRRRRRQIVSSDEEEGHDHQKETMTVIATEVDLKNCNGTVTTAAVDLEKHTHPNNPPTIPTKKRIATEACPSPPPTKKSIRVSHNLDGGNKLVVVKADHKPSKMKRHNKPRPIVLSKRNDVDDVDPVNYEMLTPQELWEEKSFDLSSPRLVRPLPLRYKLVQEKSPLTGDSYDRVFIPNMPADNIKKDLVIHPKHTELRWAGEWAERKRASEIAMYERVKKFWLFNWGYAYCPSWDCKHEFVAVEFAEEMQRPRVVAWLAELIGREDVYMVLDYLECRMTKELEKMEEDENDEQEEELEREGESEG